MSKVKESFREPLYAHDATELIGAFTGVVKLPYCSVCCKVIVQLKK